MINLLKSRILVTPTSFGVSNPTLKTELESQIGEVIYNTTGKPLSSQQVAALLPGVHGYIAGLDEIDRGALVAADSLRAIVRYGMGFDKIDLVAANEKGIIVSNTPGANATSVAELAIGLLLMLARQIPRATEAIKSGEWPRLTGVSLEGKIIGIVGLGAIGKQLARRLSNFDCQVIAYDPMPDVEFSQRYNISLVDLETLKRTSDFISLHCPVLPETRGMVDKVFIHSMKKGAYLVNTARGELIDESALIKGLESGQIAGAGLDAFKKEPPDPNNPLLSFPQVICTPHLGAQTYGATEKMGRMTVEECLRILRGEKPKNQIN